MLVLGISGSPRRNGNTEILLDEALKSAGEAGADTEKVILQKMKFSPCIACGSCDNTGICVLKDDMQELYEKIIAADALIVSTPIYFYNVSACLKAAIDRAQALWARRYYLKEPLLLKDKPGYLISVGATKGKRLFKGTILTIRYYYNAAGYVLADQLLVRGVDNKGDINKHPEYLKAAAEIGRLAAQGK